VTNTQDYAHHLKGLSPIGVAVARFAIGKPGLSMPQKDRVAAANGPYSRVGVGPLWPMGPHSKSRGVLTPGNWVPLPPDTGTDPWRASGV
jgi:hypothetical protein